MGSLLARVRSSSRNSPSVAELRPGSIDMGQATKSSRNAEGGETPTNFTSMRRGGSLNPAEQPVFVSPESPDHLSEGSQCSASFRGGSMRAVLARRTSGNTEDDTLGSRPAVGSRRQSGTNDDDDDAESRLAVIARRKSESNVDEGDG